MCVDGTTVILSGTLRIGSYVSIPAYRAPVFAGVPGQAKQNRIGYDRIIRISPLPRTPVFARYSGR